MEQPDPEYRKLHTKYQNELRDILKKRFDRFAVLHRWNFADPSAMRVQVETPREARRADSRSHREALTNDLFVPEDFEDLVLEAAANNASVGKLLRELQEPRPAGSGLHPLAGRNPMKERMLRLCARGKIAINLRGMEYLQTQPGEDEDTAWRRLRPKLSLHGTPARRSVPVAALGGACHRRFNAAARARSREAVDCSGGGAAPRRTAPATGGDAPAAPTHRRHAVAASSAATLRRLAPSRARPVEPGHVAAQPHRQARRLGYRPGHARSRK